MSLKILMKNPVLVIGILLMVIFLTDLKKRGKLGIFDRPDYIPHSCKAVLVMLDKRIPNNWDTSCDENNLVVKIDSQLENIKPQNLKAAIYRNMANHFIFIGQNSPSETLERVFSVHLKIDHPILTIDALSSGEAVAKLATIKRPEFIADHLKASIQVKETFK